MKKLRKNELEKINGGFKITAAILTAGLAILKSVFEVGRYVGSSVRRISTKNICSLR